MDKLDMFKEFIKDKEYLIDRVLSKETTWQDLYEIYDLYGESASIFKNEVHDQQETRENDNKDEKQTNGENKVSSLLRAFEGVDVNKINENLEGVRKILTVLGEFTKKDDGKVKRTYDRPSSRYDD